MVETQKKVIDRNVAIALGIICIILAVCLMGAIGVYTSTINDRNNTITSDDSQIANLQSQISSLNLQIASKNSQISSLDSLLNGSLSESLVSQTVFLDPGSGWYWTFPANSSCIGYITVAVQIISGGYRALYVEVTWNARGMSYDSGQIDMELGGTVPFLVLPDANVRITISNSNPYYEQIATITITSHY